ncbi:ATP-binding cassette domain-containing protein [Lacihabitans sp. LS3-19]|uniref:ABC transporter ATP-binding protein n=1 Tax=Lacihabitans sp. LS3-19 TaxID=2487335 RepID=UPI0020CF27BE|nr:ATP-binding cassette domain-containing protein [Lacihabitans sp. LS3-19]MCP9767429.1 ATP-binding cassette domain-containing protein [Lacihabitans sp. LS3-19]
MLITNSLAFSYGNNNQFDFPNIKLKPKETLLILGNSGTGKTTLLNILALLIQPKSGSLIIEETETTGLNSAELTNFRAKNIGIIFQKPYFVNALNVADNLLLANYLGNKALDKGKMHALANSLGLHDLLRNKVQELSGGEQQRVSIARALMNTPKIILADEPTSALDDENCEKVADLLETQANAVGAALVIVTHDQRLKSRFSNQITL